MGARSKARRVTIGIVGCLRRVHPRLSVSAIVGYLRRVGFHPRFAAFRAFALRCALAWLVDVPTTLPVFFSTILLPRTTTGIRFTPINDLHPLYRMFQLINLIKER